MPALLLPSLALLLNASGARAAELTVLDGESIQAALDAALPGDTITVESGTYVESLLTAVDGAITLQAAEGATVVVQGSPALTVSHADLTVENLIFEGAYAAGPVVTVGDGGHRFRLVGGEVRESARSCLVIGAPEAVRIERTVIHHCLWWEDAPEEAHAVVAGAVQGLLLSAVELHTFSGSGVQLDPDRAEAGWADLTIESSTVWLAPLTEAVAGFSVGAVPGRSALETRTATTPERATVVVRDTWVYGFKDGPDPEAAAFNLKEKVDVTLDRVRISDSAIGLRALGPSDTRPDSVIVRVQNSLFWDLGVALQAEDEVATLQVWNDTLGLNVTAPLVLLTDSGTGLDLRNTLVVGTLPAQAVAALGNLATDQTAFEDAVADDYHLIETATAVDAGVELPEVIGDLDQDSRPQGLAWDVGADERITTDPGTDTGGADGTDGTGADTGLTVDDTGVPTTPGTSAAMDAGEKGGCSCTTAAGAGPWGRSIGLIGLASLLSLRLSRARRR